MSEDQVLEVSPRVLSGGRVLTAPAGTPLATMMEALRGLGASADMASRMLGTFTELAESPKEELMWRLNERLQGREPGKPYHWRGLS